MTPFTVLCIEDNRFTREIVRLTLTSAGFTVLEAPDGRTALGLMAERQPDLILQDLMLPDIDGVNLLHRLQAFPGADRIPILAFSAFTAKLEELRELKAGFSDYLAKPIEPEDLLKIIQRYSSAKASAC